LSQSYRSARLLPGLACLLVLAACSPTYSPDTYASSAVQQASKVDQGVIVGRRRVDVTPAGVTGAATGAAAGGIAGSQLPGSSATQALGVLGGGLVGGVIGSAVERSSGKVFAFEYVVRRVVPDKANGDLVSVTQQDAVPLPIGSKVLVIAGSQARIVPDYTVTMDPAAPQPGTQATAPPPPAVTQAPLPDAPPT